MEHLNFVSLIHAGSITTGILGGLLLWLTKTKEFNGIALLLFLVAFSAVINLVEESGLTRELHLISPIFIMLFGPASYLAAKLLIDKNLDKTQLWHLLPVIPFLLLTSYTATIIALGTLWRLVYAALTIKMLISYKRALNEQRSDADDYSLHWLVWVLGTTAIINVFDLIRLNFQYAIPVEINLLGQGIQNTVWLVATMIIIVKLVAQEKMPKNIGEVSLSNKNNNSQNDDYRSIFDELDMLIKTNQWFLKPRVTLGDIAHLTGLQTRDISRAINVVTDKSFNEYVNCYRVEFVCELLASDNEKSLSEIFADAGFSSKASFNKVFKAITGVTPTEYKAQKRLVS